MKTTNMVEAWLAGDGYHRHRRVRRRLPGDVGQAIGLLLVAITLIATIATAMVSVAGRMMDRSAARTAADAAALAGTTGGHEAASSVAARNGAVLMAFHRVDDGIDVSVTVVVRVDAETATARASTAP